MKQKSKVNRSTVDEATKSFTGITGKKEEEQEPSYYMVGESNTLVQMFGEVPENSEVFDINDKQYVAEADSIVY